MLNKSKFFKITLPLAYHHYVYIGKKTGRTSVALVFVGI